MKNLFDTAEEIKSFSEILDIRGSAESLLVTAQTKLILPEKKIILPESFTDQEKQLTKTLTIQKGVIL